MSPRLDFLAVTSPLARTPPFITLEYPNEARP